MAHFPHRTPHFRPPARHRVRLLIAVGATVASLAATPGIVAAAPDVGVVTATVDNYPTYVGQSTCDPTEKPGTQALRSLLLGGYPGSDDFGITRACADGGTSEHKEGRAFDWGVSAADPIQKAWGDEVTAWMQATDVYGCNHGMARRLGIMYMIWNRRIWSTYRPADGWRDYTGTSPHTDHVHFSQTWDGAYQRTSFWSPPPTAPAATCQPYGATALTADLDGNASTDTMWFDTTDGTWHLNGLRPDHVFGSPGDAALAADFDGDGRADLAVYRPGDGRFYIEGVAPSGIDVGGRGRDLPLAADFNGDGRADPGVFKAGRWYVPNVVDVTYGAPGDIPAPADYNGDGRADLAVFRPSDGRFYIRGIADSGLTGGQPGDIPMPGPWLTTARATPAVYRPSEGTWRVWGSSDIFVYGAYGDVPVAGNFVGDGRWEAGVFRSTTRAFQTRSASSGPAMYVYGAPGDVPVPGDYAGDRVRRAAVFRPENGRWFVRGVNDTGTTFGAPGDIPVARDYSGVGRLELAVFRPETGRWFVQGRPAAGVAYGAPGDIPVPGDYNGDGRAEFAVFRPSDGRWYIQGVADGGIPYGAPGDVPVPADYTNAGKVTPAVFRPSNGGWYVRNVDDGGRSFGQAGDVAVPFDLTGDGRADYAVFRPSNGRLYVSGATDSPYTYGRGAVAVPGAWTGLNGEDPAVWTPSTAIWTIGNPLAGRVAEARSAPQALAPPGDPVAAASAAAIATAATTASVVLGPGPASGTCPVSDLRVSWTDVPTGFARGAVARPLGPVPTAATTHAAGVVTCASSRYAVMGFDAEYDNVTATWRILPIPADD